MEKNFYLGMKKANVLEIQEERDKRMRSEYYDPIARFPDKTDQLSETFNQVEKQILFYNIIFFLSI
jgi:hypothetical protein